MTYNILYTYFNDEADIIIFNSGRYFQRKSFDQNMNNNNYNYVLYNHISVLK